MPDSLLDHRVRHFKINSTLVIQLHGRREIDIGKGILLLAIAVEHDQHFICDRIVLYFLDALVQKDHDDRQVFLLLLKLGRLLGWRRRLGRRRLSLAFLAQFLDLIGETIDLIHRLVLRVIIILRLRVVRGTGPIPVERTVPAVVVGIAVVWIGSVPISAETMVVKTMVFTVVMKTIISTVVVKTLVSNNQVRSMVGMMEAIPGVEA